MLKVENHGTLCLVRGLDDATQAILEAGAPANAMRWAGAIVVEPRFVAGVVAWVREQMEGAA